MRNKEINMRERELELLEMFFPSSMVQENTQADPYEALSLGISSVSTLKVILRDLIDKDEPLDVYHIKGLGNILGLIEDQLAMSSLILEKQKSESEQQQAS